MYLPSDSQVWQEMGNSKDLENSTALRESSLFLQTPTECVRRQGAWHIVKEPTNGESHSYLGLDIKQGLRTNSPPKRKVKEEKARTW